jgi:hypothetical protein
MGVSMRLLTYVHVKSHPSGHAISHVYMLLFVHLRDQVLSICIEFEGLIPIAFSIGRADGVHLPIKIKITGEESVWTDARNRSCREDVSVDTSAGKNS